MTDITTLKKAMRSYCLLFADQRIAHINQAMENASDAANDETKSSAGDKHETGRAMAQLEQENNSRYLQEALMLKNTVLRIDPEFLSDTACSGSLVFTDQGNFYLSIPAGKILFEDSIYYAVSPLSPAGALMVGKKGGDRFRLNGRDYLISKVI